MYCAISIVALICFTFLLVCGFLFVILRVFEGKRPSTSTAADYYFKTKPKAREGQAAIIPQSLSSTSVLNLDVLSHTNY